MADDKKNPKVNKEIDDENLDKAAGGFADINLVTKPVTTFPENDGIFEKVTKLVTTFPENDGIFEKVTKPVTTFPENDGIFEESKAALKK